MYMILYIPTGRTFATRFKTTEEAKQYIESIIPKTNRYNQKHKIRENILLEEFEIVEITNENSK